MYERLKSVVSSHGLKMKYLCEALGMNANTLTYQCNHDSVTVINAYRIKKILAMTDQEFNYVFLKDLGKGL